MMLTFAVSSGEKDVARSILQELKYSGRISAMHKSWSIAAPTRLWWFVLNIGRGPVH